VHVHPIVAQIVDRQHVSRSNRAVIRAVVNGLKHGHDTWMGIPRKDRRKYMRQAIYQHGANFTLYAYVMGGR